MRCCMAAQRRIGLVPPRYGDDVVGGAELVLREAAHGLAARGWDVEVLTTCARDHFTWANHYAPGAEEDGKVVVRRFPTVTDTSGNDRRMIEAEMLQGLPISVQRQHLWMNDGLRVPELYQHLLVNADSYRALVFSPYLFWTTFACGQISPERTILRPCLHDEPYARLQLFQPLFSGVRGVWFNAEPERELAESLFQLPARQRVVGEGFDVPTTYDPDGFRSRYGIAGRFILYGGRREGAKRWEWLLDAFADATVAYDLPFSLVTFGSGEVDPPEQIADRVIDLGFVSTADRNDAFAAADAYVQPSSLESFSRTVMEAWLAGTPVIANDESAVVRWHCERSGAGLTFIDEEELAQCLRFVAEEPAAARSLAARGRDYVLEHYQWPSVLDVMEQTIEAWVPG